MIVWGSRGREKEVGSGTFVCPVCRAPRLYTRIRADRYFTLYFIPLFRTKHLGEYVRCSVCAGAFTPEVLDLPARGDATALRAPATGPVCPTCGAPFPEGGRFCERCGTPASSPAACSACGHELRPGVRFCPGCGARA